MSSRIEPTRAMLFSVNVLPSPKSNTRLPLITLASGARSAIRDNICTALNPMAITVASLPGIGQEQVRPNAISQVFLAAMCNRTDPAIPKGETRC